MIKLTALLISAAAAVSAAEGSYTEVENKYFGITTSENGNIVFFDELDLLDESEEKNIYFTIVEAVREKDISVGVISNADTSNEAADYFYSMISEDDTDFALMLFNEDDYAYHFYGSAETEFANADEEFWMTNAYMDEKHYFVGAVQFPLDIQYHTPSETPVETSAAVTEETTPPEDAVIPSDNGISTLTLKNGYTAMLHDIDDSLTSDEELEVLGEMLNAVLELNFNIGIVITDDIGADKSDYGVMDFADVYYENYCRRDTNGILLLINNDNNYDWISTSGSCIDRFYGKEDAIFDAFIDYIKDGNYSRACQSFIKEVRYYGNQSYDYYEDDYDDSSGIHFREDGVSVHLDSEDFEGFIGLIIFCGFFALIAVSIFAGAINSSYKMKKNVTAANYKLMNSLVFSQKTDTYLRTYTTRRTVSSSSSGSRSRSGSRSGGSRSHRSSGGGRHGGGGRRR